MIKTNIRPLNTHTLSGNVSTQTSRHISTGTVSGDSGQNEITSNIQPTDTHSLDGNITTQSQHQISTAGMSTNIETDPIFRHSVAYNITQTDVDNWNAAYNVDMDEYVSKVELVEQSYITSDTLDEASYVTSTTLDEASYVTSATLDAAAYVTHEFLSAQAYLTSVEFPDYSNTYQAKGDYITPTDLDNAAYLTNETDPVFSASPAAGITEQDIQNWNNGAGIDLSSYVTYEFLSAQSYITPAQLYSMSYITINDVVFPDYSNTYQAKGDYITPSMLGMAAYVTISQLVAQSYLTSESDPIFTSSPAGSITDTDIANWNAASGGIDMSSYVTKSELVSQSYITINDVVFPDYSNTYQAKGNYVTQEVLTQQAYLTSESDPIFSASPAAGITAQDIQNWNAGGAVDLSSYVTYEYLSAQSYLTSVTFPDYSNTYQAKGNYLTSETDPVFSASPAAGITTQDIQNWNAGGSVDLNAYVKKQNQEDTTISVVTTFPSGEFKSRFCRINVHPGDADYNNNASIFTEVNRQPNGNYVVTSQMSASNPSVTSSIEVHPNAIWVYSAGTMTLWGDSFKMKYGNVTSFIASYQYVLDQIGTYVVSQSYLTSETDPVFSASPAAGITATDIANWNSGSGVDLSSYVSYEFLSSQSYITPAQLYSMSYITINDVVFPDYSNTYQAKGDYITPTVLNNQSYVTTTMLNNQAYITPTVLNNQSYVTSSTLTSCGYTTVRLVTEAQYQDQQDDILYVITDADPIDVSDCVRQSELVAQAYVNSTALAGMSYVTQSTVVFPDYANTYQAKGDYVTKTQLKNQSYVTAAQLYAQSYVTQNSIVFPNYNNTYQAKGDYITPTVLNNQSYVTSTTLTSCGYTTVRLVTEAQYQDQQDDILYVITDADPIDVSDCVRQSELVAQAYVTQTTLTAQSYVTQTTLTAQSYVTPATLVAQSYVTKSDLSAQSYVTQNTVVFPDYSNTYQAKGDYITPSVLVAQSYVTTATLSNQSYVTPTTLVAQSYTTSTYVFDNYTSYSYINDRIDTDLVTKAELAAILANYMPKPDIIYETDGTTGLLGENASSMNLTSNWQLENVDFSGYRYVLAFIKQADLPISGTNNQYITPALVVYIPLDAASRSTEYDAYVGSTGGTNMNDPDVHFIVQCAIDSTKTKFKVVNEGSVAGTIWGDRNNRGRYCYKIEGYK